MHEDLILRLIGVAPLLMHAARLADPLDPYAVALAKVAKKRAKTVSDYQRMAEVEWRGGLWLSGGRPCIPAEALEAAAVGAARARRAGTLVRAAVTVRDSPLLEYPGPQNLDELFADKAFVHRCGVRVNRKTSIRTRPQFVTWSAEATFSYLPSMIDGELLREVVALAGTAVGIGDYRPRFGRFRIEAA